MNFKFILMLFLLIPVVSANGLITTNDTFWINKTVGNNQNFIFQLTNADSFDFFNITIENSDIINFTKIPKLTSGNITNITATVTTNNNFNGTIKIKGYYSAKLGTSNITKIVDIKYDNGITPCVFSIIKGDTVQFNNLANRNIVLKNSETNADITSLSQDQNYTQQFNEPLTLNFYASWLGFRFTQICTLTVLSDVGYINDPSLDANLKLLIDVNYEPTTIQSTFLETNYTIDVYTTEEGLFLVKNTGNKTAKNIHITNSWFSFTPNNFDLEPGVSKTVSYIINPIIHATNETGKNWEQIITITGNFENFNQKMNIFVNYADIDSGNYTNSDSIISILAKYCSDNPNVPFCKSNPTVIYKNDSSGSNMSQEQFRAILEYWYIEFEGIKEYITWSKEKINNMESNMTSIAVDNNVTRSEVENIKTENVGVVSTLYFVILGVCIFTIIAGGSYLIYYFRRERKNKELRKW